MGKHDQNPLWKALPDFATTQMDIGRVAIRTVSVGSQIMVSGALAAAAARARVDAEGAGAFGVVSGDRYSLRLARDRFLIVSGDPDVLTLGWNADGYAVTEMSGAFTVFEISGPDAIEIVKCASTISLTAPGPCTTVSFAGVTVCLYRFGDENTVRVHVDRGLAGYLWQWFTTLCTMRADPSQIPLHHAASKPA